MSQDTHTDHAGFDLFRRKSKSEVKLNTVLEVIMGSVYVLLIQHKEKINLIGFSVFCCCCRFYLFWGLVQAYKGIIIKV